MAFAQKADTTNSFKGLRHIDKVLTKQGYIYQGKIVEMGEEVLVMDILGGFRLHLNQNAIKKIEQICLNCNDGNANRYFEKYNFKEKGIYTHLAGGVISGIDDLSFSAHATVGKMERRSFGYGGGVGVFTFINYGSRKTFIPIFGEVRSYLKSKKNSPFVAFKAGYGIEKKQKFQNIWQEIPTSQRGGLFLHPSIGFRMGASEGINFIFDFGFLFQQSRNNYQLSDEGVGTEWIKYKYQRWQFNIGVLF